jgi:hypothetical protein
MSTGPIGNNPDAVQQVGGTVVGLIKQGIKTFTKTKKSKTDEMTDSARLHKTVLAVQKAEHSHELAKMRLAHEHFNNLNVRAGKAVEYESGGTKVKGTYVGKSLPPKPTKPASTRSRSTSSPASTRARQGK